MKQKHQFRPLAYICCPYRGDVQANIEKAREYAKFAVREGFIPMAWHLLFDGVVDEETERDLAMFMDLVMLGKCPQVWVFGSHITEGMQREIETAERQQKVVRYFTEDLQEVER